MNKSRRHYSQSEKLRILEEVRTRVFNGETILDVCHDNGLPVQNYYRWLGKFEPKDAEKDSGGSQGVSTSLEIGDPRKIILEQQRKIEDLERRLGQLSYQNLVLQERLRGS